MSKAKVPDSLNELMEQFNLKVRMGAAHYSSSGFGGKGLEKLDKDRDLVKRIQKKALGAELGEDEELDEDEKKEKIQELEANFESKVIGTNEVVEQNNTMAVAKYSASGSTSKGYSSSHSQVNIPGLAKAKDIIATFANRISAPGFKGSSFCYEIEINDYPQRARWMVTSKEQINMISETTGAAVTTRGSYFAPGTFVPSGKRKLYLVRFFRIESLIVSVLKAILNLLWIKQKQKSNVLLQKQPCLVWIQRHSLKRVQLHDILFCEFSDAK